MKQFAARYVDRGTTQTSPRMSWPLALDMARTLRSTAYPDACVVSREPGGEWQQVWPKPNSAL